MIAETNDAETRMERERLDAALRATRDAGVTLSFWWRDDDAITVTPELEKLLDLRQAANVPLALAVIPKFAEAGLFDRVRQAGNVGVLQHGWAHDKHTAAGEKASEFCESRPLQASMADLIAGRERLQPMAGDLFLPVLTPPWNRIGDAARAARPQAGLPGLSVFGLSGNFAKPDRHVCNTHFDVIAWKTTRGFIGLKKAYHLLANEIEQRLGNPDEPIGILTHHLVHDAQTNAFLATLLDDLNRQPHVAWPALKDLFDV